MIDIVDNTEQRFKRNFLKVMERNSRKNQNQAVELWDSVTHEMEKRPYHNLNIITRTLEATGVGNIFFSDEVVVSLILQYAGFNPYDLKNIQKTVDHAALVLGECYDWWPEKVEKVCDIILSTKNLKCSSKYSDFSIRVMHDLKMAKMFCPWVTFRMDRNNLRKELSKLSDLQFYNSEYVLMTQLFEEDKLFSLSCFAKFNPWVKTNIERYKSTLKPIPRALVL
jgi:predicted metal-dependent HD superfamily phosphohydrolase